MTPFELGYRSRQLEYPIESNPYNRDTSDYQLWCDGWIRCDQENK
jgi:hypothetical protein